MAIPPWAFDVLRRSVGGVLEKVPSDTIDNLKKRAGDLLAELPQTAARGVDSVMRSAKAGKESLQRWSRRHIALVTPVVNASGCLCHASISGVPLSEDAIEIAYEAMQAGSLTTGAAQDRLTRRLLKCLQSSEHGVLITSSIDGAFFAVAAANRDRSIYFHRSQTQRLRSGVPVPDAFVAAGSANHRIRELGSADRVDPADTRGVDEHGIVVAVNSGVDDCIWYQDIAAASEKNLTRLIYAPAMTWQLPDGLVADGAVYPPLPSLPQLLSQHADLVITPGDGILGGPRCGLIIGDKKLLETIINNDAWPSLVADVSVQAAMVVTLESISLGKAESVPAQAMLRTSEVNLRSRAERLATRIAAEPAVRSCQITAEAATIVPSCKWSVASRQLRLVHHDLSANDWAAKLAGEVPAVVVGVEDQSIVVDLRWIQASDDAALVGTLIGHAL